MNENIPDTSTIRNIRRIIWIYFWLLLLEGALRKWVALDRRFSDPLLVVRDPVILLAYALAIKAKVFPRNGWVIALGAIGFLSLAVSFIPLWPYLAPSRILLVSGYGFRSNFLHLPLIFLLPRVLRYEDVRRFGWWTLTLLIPMSVLLVAQFRAAPDAWLNRTASGEGEMLTAALGKVRTAGTFSFVTGVVAYYSLATGFLVWAALRRDIYRNWLLFASGSALVIGIAVSGSRSVVGACVLVVGSLGIVLLLRPRAINRFGQTLLATIVLGWILSQTPLFKEGVNVLTTRFTDVAEASQQSVATGLVERALSGFEEGFFVLTKAPFLGYGLGIGTNAGAKFLTGRATFLLSEGEWSRILLESGPVLGFAYLMWRCAVVVAIGILCIQSVRGGNVLPLLIFSSAFSPLLSGQFGQPTILGYAAFSAGLALAARAAPEPEGLAPIRAPGQRTLRPERVVGRRSAYASRLHGPAAGPGKNNGAVDR